MSVTAVSVCGSLKRIPLILSAFDGHSRTVVTIASELLPDALIQGLLLRSNTSGNPRKQMPEWIHFEASHNTVTSPLEYSFMTGWSTIIVKSED